MRTDLNNFDPMDILSKTSKYSCIALVVFASQSHIVRAQSIGNISGTSVSSLSSGYSFDAALDFQSAIVFKTGSSSSQITDISLALTSFPSAATGTLDLKLYSVSSGLPSSVIASASGLGFTTLALNDGFVNTYNSSTLGAIAGVSLSPNTQYALVVGGGVIAGSGSPSYLGTFGAATYSTTGGWMYIDSLSGWQFTSWYSAATVDGNHFAIEILSNPVSPVPESSGSIAGIGLAMAGWYQLRRRQQKLVTG